MCGGGGRKRGEVGEDGRGGVDVRRACQSRAPVRPGAPVIVKPHEHGRHCNYCFEYESDSPTSPPPQVRSFNEAVDISGACLVPRVCRVRRCGGVCWH